MNEISDCGSIHSSIGLTGMGNTSVIGLVFFVYKAKSSHPRPWLTPTGTPKIISTSGSPRDRSAAQSPQRSFSSTSPTKTSYDGELHSPHGTHQASSHLELTLLLVGIHCQYGLLELMKRNSSVKPGVAFPMNCSVHF